MPPTTPPKAAPQQTSRKGFSRIGWVAHHAIAKYGWSIILEQLEETAVLRGNDRIAVGLSLLASAVSAESTSAPPAIRTPPDGPHAARAAPG